VVARPLPDRHPVHTVYNPEAIIPPQCYTKTAGTFNPCYVCHQNPIAGRENRMADGDLQLAYSFSDVGMTNHWKNLFEDRSERVAEISDAEIDAWVAEDNYSDLAPQLRSAEFVGWIPDLDGLQKGPAAFREDGFARDGSHWVAFSYKPLPSTFWPTNGATDDVMIRLAEPFRSGADGRYVEDVYKANLAIVEANVKGFDAIDTWPIDERRVGKDLDGDGELRRIERITVVDAFVGRAADHYIDDSLYPKGTEFLHTVRYLEVGEAGEISISTRMKEVRYMKKWVDNSKMHYERGYQMEAFAKEEERLPQYQYLGDWGLDNGYGWSVQGFIEGRNGQLRTATYEETLFCMGCHSSIGATFSFPRKVDGVEGWGYIDLRGMPDAPNRGEQQGEFATYFGRAGGGGEFRSNAEMSERWFGPDDDVDREAVAGAADVYELITPSPDRARLLNKAYRLIVADQDYIFGRDARFSQPENVFDFIDNETAPTLPAERFFRWDIQLDWNAAQP